MASDWHAKYMTPLGRGLLDACCDVWLLTRDHDLEFGGETGATVAPGTMARWVAGTLRGEGKHLQLHGRVRQAAMLPEVLRLRQTVRSFAPHVVHFQDSAAQDIRVLYIAGARSRSFALTVHDVVRHPGDQRRDRITAAARKMLISRAGVIFVHSDVLREALIAKESPSAPIVVVPHGVEPRPVRPLPKRPHILFFGRMSYYKGLDVLMDAMASVWRRCPQATVTIAGGGEVDHHEAFSDPRVHLRNEHISEAEVDDLFESARCVVLPYREASQSGVGSLAQSYGVPLVVTDVGALPDLVADGSGLSVSADDSEALADAIGEVLSESNKAEEMSSAAAAAVAKKSWRTVAELSVAAYREHLLFGRPSSLGR